MEEPAKKAERFIMLYVATFDDYRTDLRRYYREASTLTFEGNEIAGDENIVSKLTTLPLPQLRHRIFNMSCQTSHPDCGVLAFITGDYVLDGEPFGIQFSQVFRLIPVSDDSFYVLNHIFRLHYA